MLASLQGSYPAGCGLKLMKRLGGLDQPLLTEGNSGFLQRRLLLPTHQVIVANYLHILGLAPRLVDMFVLDGEAAQTVAYVSDHMPGGTPSKAQCSEVIEALRSAVSSGSLQLVNWNGFDDGDFACPDCNGNLLLDLEGRPRYVDTHNFRVLDYDKTLLGEVRNARSVSSFGAPSYLLGKDYLYQSVPGVRLAAKRDCAMRMSVLLRLLDQAGVNLTNRVVLDVGCNAGLMAAQYLKAGAHWVCGWDTPELIMQTERLMRAVGCTRFSLVGCFLSETTNFVADIGDFLQPKLSRAIVSYLSVRRHMGWLPTLAQTPWEFMLYEGHEEETAEDNHGFLEEFNAMIPIEICGEDSITDGTSKCRYVALLRRKSKY